jgi:small subunit ribosomal protein S2
LLHQALLKVREVAAGGGRILFVGTKRQASDYIAAAAKRCAQYFVNHRWLGGTLTNWQTVSKSINRLRELDQLVSTEGKIGLTKKEILTLTRERDKLDRSLGGIAAMGGIPDLMFVIDTNKEAIAIKEAKKLQIPVVAIVDSNCDPDEVTYPIPGNDDAARAIQLYCDLVADAVIDGLEEAQGRAGVDIGASEAPRAEPALAAPSEEEARPDA